MSNEGEQVGTRGTRDRNVPLGEPACERGEIGAVGGERVGRQTALHPHRLEKSGHRRITDLGGLLELAATGLAKHGPLGDDAGEYGEAGWRRGVITFTPVVSR